MFIFCQERWVAVLKYFCCGPYRSDSSCRALSPPLAPRPQFPPGSPLVPFSYQMQPRGSASAPSQHVSFSKELGEPWSSQQWTNDPHAKLSSSKQLHCGRPNGALEDGKNKPRNANGGYKSFCLWLGGTCLISIIEQPWCSKC